MVVVGGDTVVTALAMLASEWLFDVADCAVLILYEQSYVFLLVIFFFLNFD